MDGYAVGIAPNDTETRYFLFYKTTYLKEEVNRTEPFPSVSVPCSLSIINNIKRFLPCFNECMTK
jgi:hypothetical protein